MRPAPDIPRELEPLEPGERLLGFLPIVQDERPLAVAVLLTIGVIALAASGLGVAFAGLAFRSWPARADVQVFSLLALGFGVPGFLSAGFIASYVRRAFERSRRMLAGEPAYGIWVTTHRLAYKEIPVFRDSAVVRRVEAFSGFSAWAFKSQPRLTVRFRRAEDALRLVPALFPRTPTPAALQARLEGLMSQRTPTLAEVRTRLLAVLASPRPRPVPGSQSPSSKEGNMAGRVLRRIKLEHSHFTAAGRAPETRPKDWFFDLPAGRDNEAHWTELLHRIFYDANVGLRRREPRDTSWLGMVSFTVEPLDLDLLLTWPGDKAPAVIAKHMPWMRVAPVWESGVCYVVDAQGRYDTLDKPEYCELALSRALDAGRASVPAVHALLTRIMVGPDVVGAVRTMLEERTQRVANLEAIRPTRHFRRAPMTEPSRSGPLDPADIR